MDTREKVDSDSEYAIFKDKDSLYEELWDVGVLVLKNGFESTTIR